MRIFRSKSSFIFRIIIMTVVIIAELVMFLGMPGHVKIPKLTIAFMSVIFAVAFYHLIDGLQTIKIDKNGVTLEIVFIPVKSIKWDSVIEAGLGKIKLSKNKFAKQLYVSSKRINPDNLENLNRYRYNQRVIWFDFNQKAQDMLAEGLGMNS